MSQQTGLLYDASQAVDPLGDADQENAKSAKHNRAKVGSSRPSTLLYTYGPGAIMDLPQFTIMPTGLDDWDRIWNRREGNPPQIHAPRLRDVVRMHLRSPDVQLRPHPWQPKRISFSTEGNDLGVPARVFPQWLRCTGCDMLGLLSQFDYTNTHPFRTDLACFEHTKCTGRPNAPHKAARRTAVPARYLLACAAGHLDEFPYDLWVHHGKKCPKAEFPALRMIDRTAGKGASAMIRCESCEQQRPMNEAQGQAGAAKLPKCRGRHPHLDAFEPGGCGAQTRLMLIGASNLWFPATQSIIVMPESPEEKASDLADRIRVALGDKLAKYAGNLDTLRDVLDGKVDVTGVSDDGLQAAVTAALAPPPTPEEQEDRLRAWDPVDLLVPGMAAPAQAGPRRPFRGAGQRPDAVRPQARAPAAGRDHPGAGGGAAAEGQRAHRLHPHRRPGPRWRRAGEAGAADPLPPARLDRGDRGPGRGNLPAARRGAGGLVGGTGRWPASCGRRTATRTGATSTDGSPRRQSRSTRTRG